MIENGRPSSSPDELAPRVLESHVLRRAFEDHAGRVGVRAQDAQDERTRVVGRRAAQGEAEDECVDAAWNRERHLRIVQLRELEDSAQIGEHSRRYLDVAIGVEQRLGEGGRDVAHDHPASRPVLFRNSSIRFSRPSGESKASGSPLRPVARLSSIQESPRKAINPS